MKVGYYQFDIVQRDKFSNLDNVSIMLSSKSFDIIVLPELFNTGYLFNTKYDLVSLAEKIPDGETTQELIQISRRTGGYIVGTIPEHAGNNIYNTAVLVGPEGLIGTHRKIHLSNYEKNIFAAGHDIEVFSVNDVKIGIATCFEIFFPELIRIMVRKGAQILCHPANFGGRMSLEIIKTRAVENKIYTVTANRIGTEKHFKTVAEFRGESRIISPNGVIINESRKEEDIKISGINPEESLDKSDAICFDYISEWKKYKISTRE